MTTETQNQTDHTVAHLLDDLETMRGTTLRRLTDDVALLREGLHALRRDQPKVHVMVDHAERVIDALTAHIKQLHRNRTTT